MKNINTSSKKIDDYSFRDLDNIGIKLIDHVRTPYVPLWIKIQSLLVSWSRSFDTECFVTNKYIMEELNAIGEYYVDAFGSIQCDDLGQPKINHNFCTLKGIESSLYLLRKGIEAPDYDGAISTYPLIEVKLNDVKKSDSFDPEHWHYRTIKVNLKNCLKFYNEYDESKYPARSRAKKLVLKKLYYVKDYLKTAFKNLTKEAIKRLKSAREMYYRFIRKASKKLYFNSIELISNEETRREEVSDASVQQEDILRERRNRILMSELASNNQKSISEEKGKALDAVMEMFKHD